MSRKTLEKWYDSLHGEQGTRVCKDISDEACRDVPQNYVVILFSQFFTKLADIFANGKTVLPWVLDFAGVPDFFVGLLVPIRESGSLLPQLLIGVWIRRRSTRKRIFSTGSAVQGAAVLAMGIAAYLLSGALAGITIILLLVLFSIARAFCSLASKDVLGKSIPKTRRGGIGGYAGSFAGFVGVFIGIGYWLNFFSSSYSYLVLLAMAGVSWFIASALFMVVEEPEGGESNGDDQGINVAFKSLSLLKSDAAFRNFVITRCFLMGSGLAAPYYVIAANSSQGTAGLALNVGAFMVAAALASFCSAFVWGRWVDKSSRKVMIAVALLLALILLLGAAACFFNLSYNGLIFFLLFFSLMVVHQGVRQARKTYVVDLGSGAKRTDYVAVSNSVVGALLLGVGLISSIVGQFDTTAVLLFFATMAMVAMGFALRLPEVQSS